ncbi:MAG: GNAT family N-acetyltransferase [Oscillospiraceae bacterium]|nr:GNAT family N-acetyltransferase [Oscillospiraceae bacterium]
MTEYGIFKECFPQLKLNESQFNTLVNPDNCKQIKKYDGDKLTGFAYIYRSCLRLLCVSPEYQGRGIGAELLKEAEEMVMNAGYSGITAGGLDSGLFIGEVISKEQFEAQGAGYLKKHGYTANHGCVEMALELEDFSAERADIPEDTEFRLYKGDKAELLEAVKAVDPDWVEYFRYAEDIFAAEYKGKLAGMCILGFDDVCLASGDGFKTGNIGCVGVIPEMRRKGIGLAMVAKAAELIKSKGCKNAFIHYTHLEKWYGKLGAETMVYCAFSGKKFSKD